MTKPFQFKINIMTLLLGPPSSGKTTLLLAMVGKLDSDLKVSGTKTYNGHGLDEFVLQRTSAYISQHDLHIGEMNVRETLAFSARCQGVGTGYEMLAELSRREKAANIKPDPNIDVFMKGKIIGELFMKDFVDGKVHLGAPCTSFPSQDFEFVTLL